MQRSRKHILSMFTGVMLILLGVAGEAAGKAGSVWGADYFPNVPLVTHEREIVRFFDDLIKEKVVVINFIFTRCPDVCPLETARLLEVQKILGDRVGKDVFMYSITIEPDYDTPEVLKRYAKKFQIRPGWLFLTGKEADITMLRKKLGLWSEEDESGDLSAHTVNLIMGNQSTGQWIKGSPFENPYILAEKIGNWLHNWKLPPKQKRDYADAPDLRPISRGETIYRTRCSACHKIGVEEEGASKQEGLGPNLLHVTRKRDRAWLSRYVKEPDKMLAEKDPLAVSLLAEYKNLRMPNLRLNDEEIQALLEYIEEESHRVEHRKSGHHH